MAAVLLVGITASGSFRRWERAIFLFIATSLVLYPLALASQPHYGAIAYHLVVPGIQGGASSTAVLLIIAIVGTTVAPWQLFFQQSNVIDKRITPRFIGYERADTTFGAVVVVVGAIAIEVVAVFAVRGTNLVGKFTDALGVARALEAHAYWMGALFAIVLLDASIIGASAVTLSTSYAFGDVFGLKHSLHRSFRDAKSFYLSYAALVIVAAGIVLIPGAPLGLITDQRPGPGRGAAAQRERVPAAAVQRPGGARPLGQPALAQHPGQHHHRCPAHAVGHPCGQHGVPERERLRDRDRARHRPAGGRRRGRPVAGSHPAPPGPAPGRPWCR